MGFKQVCTIKSGALQLNQREKFLLLRHLQPPVRHDQENKITVSGVYQSYYAIGSMGSCTGSQGPHLSSAVDSRTVTSEICRDREGLSPHAEAWRESLQREIGRIGSPEPNQSKSEGDSDWKTDHRINSRNRKRLVHSMIVLI